MSDRLRAIVVRVAHAFAYLLIVAPTSYAQEPLEPRLVEVAVDRCEVADENAIVALGKQTGYLSEDSLRRLARGRPAILLEGQLLRSRRSRSHEWSETTERTAFLLPMRAPDCRAFVSGARYVLFQPSLPTRGCDVHPADDLYCGLGTGTVAQELRNEDFPLVHYEYLEELAKLTKPILACAAPIGGPSAPAGLLPILGTRNVVVPVDGAELKPSAIEGHLRLSVFANLDDGTCPMPSLLCFAGRCLVEYSRTPYERRLDFGAPASQRSMLKRAVEQLNAR